MSGIPEHHSMFLYDNDDDFVDRITSLLGPATEDGEAALAVLAPEKWALLCEALGDKAQRIQYLERESIYTRPLETLAGYDTILRQVLEEGAPAVRLIGELPVSGSAEQCDTWTFYEAVLSLAFADRPISILCGYDLREQPAGAVEAAWKTHPLVLDDGWGDNPRYVEPAGVAGPLTAHPEPVAGLRELPVDADATAFNARLREELARLGLRKAPAENLLLAASAVFHNAQTHGQGARSQRIGRAAGRIVWELSDSGSGFSDPLAGYVPPRQGDADGPGLWMARQLTERVEFFASPGGFTTRLWI
jgi:MEDS: MEthanogen/methylotroph, DcmR Sensory domain